MRIRLKNEFGIFEVGGGSHPTARLLEITGIGLPERTDTTVTFEGQPGQVLTNSRVQARTVTMSFDFFGDEKMVEKFYRIVYRPLELEFFLGDIRRRIGARCRTATDIKKIIYREWQSVTLQFVCDDPFFYDLYDTKQAISKTVDMWPIENSEGVWQISLPSVATKRSNETTIYNNGDAEIYPVITLEKHIVSEATVLSAESIILNNQSTGKSITLDYEISTDEQILVDLPNRRITSSINGDLTNYISDDTVLGNFYLAIGENVITIKTNSDIYAVAEFSNKYISVVI